MARGAALKYGWVEGDGKGREYPAAATQYFHRRGGHFCKIDSAGNVTLATALASQLYGWAETAKDDAGKSCWKSSGTAGADKVFVIFGATNKFEMPLDTSAASANATLVGKGAGISTTSATATYNQIQKAYYRATAASCLFTIYDYDPDNQTVVVSIRPSKLSIQ